MGTDENSTHEIRLSVRVTKAEKALVKNVADRYGLTITDFIIHAARYIDEHNPQLTISPQDTTKANLLDKTEV